MERASFAAPVTQEVQLRMKVEFEKQTMTGRDH